MSPSSNAGQWVAPVISLAGARAERADAAQVSDDDRARAEQISMRALSRRGLSRRELVDRLLENGLDRAVAEVEADRLERVGLINDVECARVLLERLVERKKLGRGALRGELRQRKLDADAIEQVLADYDDDSDPRGLIETLVSERVRRMGSLDRATAERRLLGYLQRKGHGGALAHEVVRRALDGAPGPRRTPEFE